MIALIGKIIAYIFKNLGLIVGIAEAVLKVGAGIVSLTPTKKDDAVYAIVDKVFSWVKKWIYTVSDKLAGKEVNIPNS